MKFKFNKKLLTLLSSFIFLAFSIISIRDTYARYITSLTTKSYVELGSWQISINDHDIMNNSNFSGAILPLANTSTQYVTANKIVPGVTGDITLKIDYSNVRVPFKYELSYTPDNVSFLEDIKFTNYTIDATTSEYTGANITNTITPDGHTTMQTLKLTFTWLDGTDESSDDVQDTNYANILESIKLNFNISFTQIQPAEVPGT